METSVSYIAFSEIGVTIGVIVAAMTFIVLTWNAVKAIRDWRASAKKPTDDRIEEVEHHVDDHEERITTLEACCEEMHGKAASDSQFRNENIEMNRLMLLAIKQMLKHEIDGNDTAGLSEMEDRIDKYLVEHIQQ